MGKSAGSEVESDDVIARMRLVVQWLERGGLEGRDVAVLVVGEAIEQMVVLADLVIQLSNSLHFTERRQEVTRVRLKGWARQDRLIKGLLGTLGIDEEKQFVLDQCSAEVAAELISLEIGVRSSRQIGVEW